MLSRQYGIGGVILMASPVGGRRRRAFAMLGVAWCFWFYSFDFDICCFVVHVLVVVERAGCRRPMPWDSRLLSPFS